MKCPLSEYYLPVTFLVNAKPQSGDGDARSDVTGAARGLATRLHAPYRSSAHTFIAFLKLMFWGS